MEKSAAFALLTIGMVVRSLEEDIGSSLGDDAIRATAESVKRMLELVAAEAGERNGLRYLERIRELLLVELERLNFLPAPAAAADVLPKKKAKRNSGPFDFWAGIGKIEGHRVFRQAVLVTAADLFGNEIAKALPEMASALPQANIFRMRSEAEHAASEAVLALRGVPNWQTIRVAAANIRMAFEPDTAPQEALRHIVAALAHVKANRKACAESAGEDGVYWARDLSDKEKKFLRASCREDGAAYRQKISVLMIMLLESALELEDGVDGGHAI